jgi:hypothetical protein
VEGSDAIVFFGLQYFIKAYLMEQNNLIAPKPPVIMRGQMLLGKNNKGKKKK